MPKSIAFVVVIGLVILSGWFISVQSKTASDVVVLEGARLIDGTGAAPRENAAVVIEGDHIQAIGIAGKMHYPKGARVVDVHGRTIIPSFINSHGHL